MKKVGIITFHCADNFGAVLQAYALQTIIEKLKFNVEIINFRPKALTEPYDISINPYMYLKNKQYMQLIRKIGTNICFYFKKKERILSFEKFRNIYLKLSEKKYFTPIDLKINPPQYDYYITGSDQVWNPFFKKQIGNSYFLDFVNKKTKIAYAASITENVDIKEIIEYKNLISDFDYISLREKSHLEFVKMLTNQAVEVVLDPTLLLERNKWEDIIVLPEIDDKYILVYNIENNPEIIHIANFIAQKLNLKIIPYQKKKYFINVIQDFKFVGPREFLGLINKAEVIITNSFHGTAFSLIFNKPFYTIPHTTRGVRMKDLLETVNLSKKLIYDIEDINFNTLYLDLTDSLKIINEKRIQSINFLKKSLDIY